MALWRDIAGYEGLYQVSDEGQVKSLARRRKGRGNGSRVVDRVLKPGTRDGGYKFVVLSDGKESKCYSIHRLVAQAFVPNPDNLPQVNHKDENPLNNHASNLEWCTQQYNLTYSNGVPIRQFDKNCNEVGYYQSISEASKATGIGRTAINNAIAGWCNTSGGYYWRLANE